MLQEILQYVVPTVGSACVAGVFSFMTVRHTKRATRSADEAATKTAQAAVDDTFTRAYEAADKHWARYLEANERRNEQLTEEVQRNTLRIEQAEMRAEAERVARTKAEHLYAVSIIYLRRVIRWINEYMPDRPDYPRHPPEIDADLDISGGETSVA
jgi:hypothetical protein